MKIAVIGATGKVGRLVSKEAKRRGHEVVAVTRPMSINRLEDSYQVIPKDLFDLTTDDLKDFDVVVDAFGTSFTQPGQETLHVTSMAHLISIMEPIPDVRLVVVGGAASLYKDETKSTRLIDNMSPDFSAVPRKMFEAYQLLAASKVNYTYMSPAENFDASSAGVGTYTLGTDVVLYNKIGTSYITYEDYSLAMVDELENKQFIRKRFTAVSESKFKNDGKNFIELGSTAFTRQGCWFGIFSAGFGTSYGKSQLYIGTRREGARKRENKSYKLFDLYPVYQGHRTPYSVLTTPVELLLRTQHGIIKICFPEENLMVIKGENGLGIHISGNLNQHEVIKPRGDKSWEAYFAKTTSLVFSTWTGFSEIDAKWDWSRLSTPIVEGDFLPDDNGILYMSIEDSEYAGYERKAMASYEEGLSKVQSEWKSFLDKQPLLSARYAEERDQAAWMTWTHLMSPSGKIIRPHIFMDSITCASEWQMCENAVALKNNLPIAIELMLNMLDMQAPTGQLPDFYGDGWSCLAQIKPPIQGWALEILMDTHDFSTEVPRDYLEMMYEGYGKWANWFFTHRDNDQDGIPQYEDGDETGNDDSNVFRNAHMVEMPDLCAFLALIFEYEGRLGSILGKKDDEISGWYEKSKKMIQTMIDTFWNGERFIGLTDTDHKVVDTENLIFYRPIVLGKRLPQNIIDKMAEDLQEEGAYLSPYGLLSQKMTSPEYTLNGFSNGRVGGSENLLIATGLYAAGKKDLAKEIARRFCDGAKFGGSQYYAVMRGFFGSWGAAAFQILADLECNM